MEEGQEETRQEAGWREREERMRRRLENLASSFPALRGKPGVVPWNSDALDTWAARGASHGERLCAQFVLSVWNHQERWHAGPFEVVTAFMVLDEENRAAFLAWAREPWWA